MLTNSQYQTLANHIRANVTPAVVAALAVRNDDVIRDHYNEATTTDVWDIGVDRLRLFESMNIGQYDNLTAGKRDAWRLLLEQAAAAPLDFGRPKVRNAIRDIWATAQADQILTDCIRKATRGELVFGGSVETSGTISANDLNVEVTLSSFDISKSLNEF